LPAKSGECAGERVRVRVARRGGHLRPGHGPHRVELDVEEVLRLVQPERFASPAEPRQPGARRQESGIPTRPGGVLPHAHGLNSFPDGSPARRLQGKGVRAGAAEALNHLLDEQQGRAEVARGAVTKTPSEKA